MFRSIRLLAALIVFAVSSWYAAPAALAQQQQINCTPNVPCTTAGPPSISNTGDPMWKAFGKVNSNETQLFSQGSSITTLQGQMTTADGNISTLQGQMTTADGNITTLQGQMTTANTNITTNTSILGYLADFNVMAYGAKCDGSTDDTAAINSAFAAALASPLYSPGYEQVTVSGPRDGSTHSYCKIGASGFGVNATGFNAWQTAGNGLSGGRLRIKDLNLYCADPTAGGVVCLDLADSINVTTEGLVIRGDQTNPPMVGMQIANVISGHACCIQHHFHPQIEGYYLWTAVYDLGGESSNYYDPVFGNGETARGSLASISFASTLAGCSGSTTYQAVPLTGGSGINATVQVKFSSGAVSTVVLDNDGIGYATSDSPTIPFGQSQISGAGCTSGQITITVNNVVSFALVEDGQNHWWSASHNTSHWITPTQLIDTQVSFTQDNLYGGSLRSNTAALWMMATTSHHFYHTYMNSESSTLAYPCIWLADRSNIGGAQNLNPYFDTRCEANKTGGVGDVFFTGINPAPTINNITYLVDYEKGNVGTTSSMFMLDPGTAFAANSVVLSNLSLNFDSPNKFNIFQVGKAQDFQVSGRVMTELGYQFNYPGFWSGSLCAGQFSTAGATPLGCSPPNYGAIDTVQLTPTQNAIAGSCSRRMYQSYTGALCNIRRASDSATMDLYAAPDGWADAGQFSAFCAGTTCFAATVYNQLLTPNSISTASNSYQNCVQSTTASQPQVAFDSALGPNRLDMIFLSGGAQAMPCTQYTQINNVWGAHTGAPQALFVVGVRSSTAAATQGRIALKEDSGTLGWELRSSAAGAASPIEFIQEAATTNLDYVSTNSSGNRFVSAQPFVLDLEYDNTSCANAPVVNLNGTAVTFATSTACSASAGADTSASNLIIGNSVASAGTNAFSGNIAEFAFFAPSAAGGLNVNQLEGLRRNAAWAYNMGAAPTVQ